MKKSTMKFILALGLISNVSLSQIIEVASGLSSPFGLAVDQASNLFISESGNIDGNKISMMFLNDGSSDVFDLFTENLSTPTKLKIYDNNLYIVETGSNEISRFNMLTSPPQISTYITGLLTPKGLDIVNNDFIVGDYGNYAIKKINTSSTPFESTTIAYDLAYDIVIDGDIYYYANSDYGLVNLNSITNPDQVSTAVVTSIAHPSSLLLYEGLLYISDSIEGKIYRINPNGGTTMPQLLVSGLNMPQSMVVFNNELYIAESGANRIVKLNLNTLSNNEASDGLIVKILPNPTQNLLNIEMNNEIKKISIFDLLGKKMIVNYKSDKVIDVSNLPIGIYNIEIIDNYDKIYSSKFIKK